METLMLHRPNPSLSPSHRLQNRRGFLRNAAAFLAGCAFGFPSLARLARAHDPTRLLGDLLNQKEYQSLLRELETRHGFPRSDLDRLFATVRLHPEIPRFFAAPFEDVPYFQYRETLVTDEIIAKGRQFMAEHEAIFEKAEASFQVDSPVIGAILGIETKFGGRASGGFLVFNALNTIFVDIPRRQDFARKELIEFLLLCREEKLEPDRVEGSYAGAMGMPQFIPSSYRNFSVDFDGDGRRDLWTSEPDVIGSVANYLSRHGWKKGAPVLIRIEVPADDPEVRSLLDRGLKGSTTLEELSKRGMTIPAESGDPVSRDEVSLVSYQENGGRKVAAVFPNFKAILKYNRALNYALAVSDLADALKPEEARSVNDPEPPG